MSMITRCPACETMFRVVPDQLRISVGWVRCGQCDEIFDASAHLVNDPPAAGTSEVAPVAPPQMMEGSENVPPVPPVPPVPAPPPAVPVETVVLSEPPLPTQLVSTDFQTIDFNFDDASAKGGSSVEPVIEGDGIVLNNHEPIDTTDVHEPEVSVKTTVSINDFSETDRAGLAAFHTPAETISFLSIDTKTPTLSRPLWRWFLVVLGLFLLLGLVAQGVYRERQRLAAWEPRLSPWLERSCDAMGCVVGPVRKIDSISVESSTFAKLRADNYRLSFSLKNSALIDVAFPAIELTLTDALDRPVLRRVLRASDLGSADTVIAASTEWPASIEIAVQSSTLPDRVAGYRLVAFYP